MSALHPMLVAEKRFYELFPERFAALYDDYVLRAIYERFGMEVFRRSSVLEGFDAILQTYSFRGRCCVEIGTCKGLTALVLARYFDEVITIDIEDDPQRREIAAFVKCNNVRFITVRNNEQKALALKSLYFDAAYLDGDHAADTELDFALVERSGRVLFHEYWPPQPAVVRLVDSLSARGTVLSQGKFALWTA